MTAPERGEDGTGEHLGGTDPVNSDPDAVDADRSHQTAPATRHHP